MKNKHVSALVAMAAVALCGLAQAGFAVEEPSMSAKAAQAPSSAQSNAGLSQIGEPAGVQPSIRGVAKDVSLITALKQIVPQGWRAKRAGGLDVNLPVTWRGNARPWTEVLHEVARSHGFTALVDWSRQEVTVAPAQFMAGQAEGFRSSSSMTALPSVPVPRSWDLVPTLTLRENIEAWAKSAGWSVSWAGVDYPVTTKVTVTGAFEDESAGPLVQLAKAYSSAEQPLTFTFYTNRVVRVENSTYKQVNVHDQLPNHRAMQ